MYWSNFLHLYQPYYQQPDVLERIVGQCYRPIIEGLLSRPDAKVTINVNAVLLELFDKHGYRDLIEKLAVMGSRGQIEFLGSAKYHTLLPWIPPEEAARQIKLNSESLSSFLGDSFNPKGIFLPEMSYAPAINQVIEDAGFEYVMLDELAFNGKAEAVDYTKRYKIAGTKLQALFRQRRMSNAIMHRAVRTPDELREAAAKDIEKNKYLVTGMDGEVFGNWYPGFDEFLLKLLEDPKMKMVKAMDLLTLVDEETECSPVACSWADSERDLDRGMPFFTWRDPENQIQNLEWELQKLTLEEFEKIPKDEPTWPEIREKLDPALASDLFFWSSARPWWSIELIEEGSFGLMDVVESSPVAKDDVKYKARDLYHQILDMSFYWRRSGKIARIVSERAEILRVPFKDRTDTPTYDAFIKLIQAQEKKAADKQDYEAAALWRDASYKLESKRDVYDAYHVIDLLRAKVPEAEVNKMLEEYRHPYSYVRGGQPEQRSY